MTDPVVKPTPFAPLDPLQPIVDDLGKITPEWYAFLKLLCDELNRLRELEAAAPP